MANNGDGKPPPVPLQASIPFQPNPGFLANGQAQPTIQFQYKAQDGQLRFIPVPTYLPQLYPNEWPIWVKEPEKYAGVVMDRSQRAIQQYMNLQATLFQYRKDAKEAHEKATKSLSEQTTVQKITQAQQSLDPHTLKLWAQKLPVTDIKKDSDKDFVPPDRAQQLLKEVSRDGPVSQKLPKCQSDVEKALKLIAEDFVASGIDFAISMAKKRKRDFIEARDLALHYQQQWGVAVPGFLTDTLKRPYKRPALSEDHRSRLAAIRRATLTGPVDIQGDGHTV